MTAIARIFHDALETLVRRGDLAAVERALIKACGCSEWDAAATAVSLCALPPERARALLERLVSRRG